MRPISIAALLLCLGFPASSVGQIVFVRNAGESSVVEEQLELASRFYGVRLRTIALQSDLDVSSATASLASQDSLGVVVTWAALPALRKSRVTSALRRQKNQGIPLLIVGTNPQPDSGQLADWSDGALSACQSLSPVASSPTYVFGAGNDVTRQLAGEHILGGTIASCSFVLNGNRSVEPLMSITEGDHLDPVFVRIKAQHTFYLADMKRTGSRPDDPNVVRIFSEIAPMMMFLRDALGDRAWHSVGHYANLSIDDAWLIEPYGHLDYAALLPEMARHNFHTTVSFIPWNFDRSRPDVVSLFRSHRDRFSVCVHGNNHDHREFSDLQVVPLGKQVANIQQAVARMEKFTGLTGISYDPVMVFPHATGPEETLAELKKYDFLATAYSLDLPLGAVRPVSPLFYLRTFNLDFANFLGLKRYFAENPPAPVELAINAFLDNPLLFYGHEKLFDGGIHAFNKIADAVNGKQPDTNWCSLGCVSRHLYLVKLRDDGNFDAEIFSNDVILENRGRQDKVFVVRKAENFIPQIKAVTVDGQSLSFRKEAGSIGVTVFVAAGQSRNLRIEYLNDWDVASVDPSKRGIRIALLRQISDFRDLTLSRYPWGRALTRFYYEGGLDSIELKMEKAIPATAFIVFVMAVSIAARFVLRRGKARRSVAHRPVVRLSIPSK
jgi:hypothetical protein